MASSMDVGSSFGPQQTNNFISNNSTVTMPLPSIAGAAQSFDANLQSIFAQLQSASSANSAVGQSASVGAANSLGSSSAQPGAGIDADGDNDGSQAQATQQSGHHHGHHHHRPLGAADGANGSASGLQNDVNKLVSDLFNMVQQLGSSTGTSSTATSPTASTSDLFTMPITPAYSTSTNAGNSASVQTDTNSPSSPQPIQGAATNIATNGPASASTLQNDVNKFVNDGFGIVRKTGSATGTSSVTTSAIGSNLPPSNSTPAAAVSSSLGSNSSSSVQAVSNSGVPIEDLVAQDFLNAVRAYSPSSLGQVTQSATPAATAGAIGPADASVLSNDVNSLVNDLLSMVQQTGSSASTSSTTTSTNAVGSNSDPSNTTTTADSSSSSSTSDATSSQADPNSFGAIENLLAQDFLNAFQAYGSSHSLQSNQSATATAIA